MEKSAMFSTWPSPSGAGATHAASSRCRNKMRWCQSSVSSKHSRIYASSMSSARGITRCQRSRFNVGPRRQPRPTAPPSLGLLAQGRAAPDGRLRAEPWGTLRPPRQRLKQEPPPQAPITKSNLADKTMTTTKTSAGKHHHNKASRSVRNLHNSESHIHRSSCDGAPSSMAFVNFGRKGALEARIWMVICATGADICEEPEF